MKHKKLLVGILTGVLILLLVLLAAGYFMVDYALKPGELTTRSRNRTRPVAGQPAHGQCPARDLYRK